MYAVVDIAGFQEKVSEGDKLRVPTLKAEEGKSVTFDKVLLLVKGDSDMKVGTPLVSGAAVEVKVVGHGKGDSMATRRDNPHYRCHAVDGAVDTRGRSPAKATRSGAQRSCRLLIFTGRWSR